jgi:hypothetical protein
VTVRRVVYRLIFPMAVVLPVWVLIGRGIIADGIGWQFVAYLFISPVLFVALMAIGGIVVARPDVRATKAVSWWDVALLGTLWLVLIASGFFAVPALAVAAVLLVLGGFWLVVWEFFAETRRRFQQFSAEMQAAAAQVPGQRPQQQPLDVGEVIVVTSQRIEPENPEDRDPSKKPPTSS